MINLPTEIRVVSNKDYKDKLLTWRSLFNLFFISEEIIKSKEILKRENGITYSLTSLNYLYDGTLFSKDGYNYTNEIKKNVLKSILEEKESELTLLTEKTSCDSNNKTIALVDKIDSLYSKIVELSNLYDDICAKINDLQSIIANQHMDRDKYSLLKKQYTSKIDRLNFIMDGYANSDQYVLKSCPICHQHTQLDVDPNFYNSIYSDYLKLKKRLKDLDELIIEIDKQINQDNYELSELIKKSKDIEDERNENRNNYQKCISQLETFKEIEMEIHKKTFLTEDIVTLKEKIQHIDSSKSKQFGLDNISIELRNEVENELKKSMRMIFDKTDVILNTHFEPNIGEHDKNFNGSGYVGIINSLIMIAIAKVLSQKNAFHGILLLDSPLTSFSDIDDDTSMKVKKFMDYISECSSLFQIIISDNNKDIPYAVQGNDAIMFIEFTKSNKGRYGFLRNYHD